MGNCCGKKKSPRVKETSVQLEATSTQVEATNRSYPLDSFKLPEEIATNNTTEESSEISSTDSFTSFDSEVDFTTIS